jgi:glutaredoxin
MSKVTLYTRVNCHLCHDVEAVLERVRAEHPFELEIVDIDGDPALRQQYDWEVPVVVVDGRKFAKYRVDEEAFRKRLRSAA